MPSHDTFQDFQLSADTTPTTFTTTHSLDAENSNFLSKQSRSEMENSHPSSSSSHVLPAPPETSHKNQSYASNRNSKSKNGSDIYENILVTLRTLQLQNRRLTEFQENSYKWHLQHHENIKKIIRGLNHLSEKLEREGVNPLHLEPTEDPELIIDNKERNSSSISSENFDMPTPNSSTSINAENNTDNLHELVMAFRHELGSHDLDSILRSVDNINTFNTLKEDSMQLILPIIYNWLSNGKTAKHGFIYLYEGARKFPEIFSSSRNYHIMKNIISRIESMLAGDMGSIGFDLDCIRELYDFMTVSLSS